MWCALFKGRLFLKSCIVGKTMFFFDEIWKNVSQNRPKMTTFPLFCKWLYWHVLLSCTKICSRIQRGFFYKKPSISIQYQVLLCILLKDIEFTISFKQVLDILMLNKNNLHHQNLPKSARFLKSAWPVWDVIQESVKTQLKFNCLNLDPLLFT